MHRLFTILVLSLLTITAALAQYHGETAQGIAYGGHPSILKQYWAKTITLETANNMQNEFNECVTTTMDESQSPESTDYEMDMTEAADYCSRPQYE